MKSALGLLAIGLLFSFALPVAANTFYVDVSNLAPAWPYTNWVSAATNIQDAVDVAAVGDDILVTNGVYQTGGRDVYGMTNRLAVTKPVTVQSVNGPMVTSIVGYQVPSTTNGDAAVRCVYLTNGAVLAGFTLTNGATQTSGDGSTNQSGGGVWCELGSAVVTNCVLTGNSAYSSGGGAFYGMLNNCTLSGNSASADGGGAFYGTLKNCVLTANSASANGGGALGGALNNCMLSGNSAIYGGGAYSASLNNCTLTANSASSSGGGAHYGTLNNCTLTGNSASSYGGGAYSATLNNCTLTANSASSSGGGAYYGTLNNCTLTGNSASSSGGGAYSAALNNCITYYNAAPTGGNYSSGTLNYCCTTPLPMAGTGNTDAEPQLASASHLSADSPCIRKGSYALTSGVDIDGEAWANPPSIGCDEYWSGSVTGALSVAIGVSYTNVAVGFGVGFQALIGGRVSGSRWDFGDGVVVSNRPWASHAWGAAGDYGVELRAYNESYTNGVAASVTVHVAVGVQYVALTSTNPLPPYTNWLTAATNIQDAVDAAVPGAVVWVSDGVYQSGVRGVYGMSNRVAVTNPLTVRSVNGPAVTVIAGSGPNGPNAVRGVYLTNGAVLAGFTLTHGATQTSGDWYTNQSGGGVWCESSGGIVTNCVLTGNSAANYGGGAYAGTLNNCTLTNNSAYSGGGACSGMLNNCVLTANSAPGYGGGAYAGTLNNCTLTANSAPSGGGAYSATLNNCSLWGNRAYSGGGAYSGAVNNSTLTGNSATNYGGGAYNSKLNTCTVTANSANSGGGAYSGTLTNCTLSGNAATNSGGGAYNSKLNNCIIYYNAAPNGSNYSSGTLNYCCTTPRPSGTGNLTNAPLFVDTNGWSNLRLQSNSPCINAGNSAYAPGATDLDGNPRIVGGTVDIGAYEYQGGALTAFQLWLQQYGLPTDGSADYVDTDNDGMNDWQEWVAGTNPTNAASVLRLFAPVVGAGGATLSWFSVTNRAYFLERALNLVPAAFSVLGTNIPGLPDTTSFTDTNPPLSGPAFYRVGVQQ